MNRVLLLIVIIWVVLASMLGYIVGQYQKQTEVYECELRAYSSMEFCTRMMDLQTKYYLSECNETRIK
jgi:hypothetical protein